MMINKKLAWAIVGSLVGVFFALFFSLQAGVWLSLFLVIGYWSWVSPVSALSFLFVLAPILPMLKITQTIGTVTLIKDVIILSTLAKVVVWPLIYKGLPYRRNEMVWPVIALGVWVAINVLRAETLLLGVLRAREIGLYVLVYLVIVYIDWRKKDLKSLIKGLSMAGCLVAGLAAFQWWFAQDSAVLRFDPERQIWIPRISSILAHPSIMGHYLVWLATGLGAAWLVGVKHKAKLLVGLIIVGVQIYLTYSRAVWLGAIVAGGLIIMAWIWKRGASRINWKAVGLAIMSLVIVGYVGLRFTNAGVFLRTAIDPAYASNAERLVFLARLVAPLSDTEALIGKGLGDVLTQNFRETDLAVIDLAEGQGRAVQLAKNTTLVDNQYLKTFVEMGLVGLLIYLWLYWIGFKLSWKATQKDRLIGYWILGFLGAFMVQGLFIDIWDIFPTNLIFWAMIGFLVRSRDGSYDMFQPEIRASSQSREVDREQVSNR